MILIFHILYFIFYISHLYTNENLGLIKKIEVPSENFTTDNLGNIYVTQENELKKYDSNGELLYTFSNNNYGNIETIDVSNSLRVLVFYADFNSIIFLDNTLSPITDFILLEEIDIFEPKLLCSSVQNGFWIFENTENRLIHFNQNCEKGICNIRINLFKENFQPNYILERNSNIYLNYPDTGIVVYSDFCNFQSIIPIPNLKNFQISGNEIIYFDTLRQKTSIYHIQEKQFSHIDIPGIEKKQDVRIEQERLYILQEKILYIYRFRK